MKTVAWRGFLQATVFFMHFRTVAGHMVLRSLYNSGCTTIPIARSQRSPGCTFAVF